jgi:hypothetical protein
MEAELSEAERKRVSDHLERCPRCARDLEAMRKTVTLLRWIPPIEVEEDFTAQVMARVRAEQARLTPLAQVRAWWQSVSLELPWRGLELPVPALASAGGLGLVAGVLMTLQLIGLPASMVDGQQAPSELATAAPAIAPAMSSPGAASGGTAAVPVATTFGRYQQPVAQGYSPVRQSVTPFGWQPAHSPQVTPFAGSGGNLVEGPPSVISVEYVIKRVHVRPGQSEPQLPQLPAGVHVENGIATF